MTMTFFLHDSIQPNASSNMPMDVVARSGAGENKRLTGEFPLLLDKLRVPETNRFLNRGRLNAIFERSIEQFPATLISGRAGAGKTALAANFVAKRNNIGWYSLETTDQDWTVFSRYFSICLSQAGFTPAKPLGDEHLGPQNAIAKFLVRHFMNSHKDASGSLIVLDDVHQIFDAEWFGDFFKLLLYSLPPSAHLAMLCRSKPPSPLWRLRSKQVLNVIEEEHLAFTTEETAELFEIYGRPDIGPERARIESFGRASKLVALAKDRCSRSESII
jgi:LuxR family maltose regulon positive regulatory protein